jgi:hypothetical protein
VGLTLNGITVAAAESGPVRARLSQAAAAGAGVPVEQALVTAVVGGEGVEGVTLQLFVLFGGVQRPAAEAFAALLRLAPHAVFALRDPTLVREYGLPTQVSDTQERPTPRKKNKKQNIYVYVYVKVHIWKFIRMYIN